MTISSTVRIAGPFIGTGTASYFPFTFKVFNASDLQVVRVDTTTGVETTLVLNTDYAVSLNADQDSNPGGSIVLTSGSLVLAVGFNMIITSDIANLQPTDLTNQGGFYPEVITDALDRATIQIQQMADELTRSIKIPVTDGLSLDMELPSAVDRANSFLSFDAAGEPLMVSAGSPGAPTSITRQQFSGTGSQVVYTLASDPGALGNSCEVFVGGVYQQRDTYTISGTTLTFSAAPVAGTDNIEIVNFLTSSIGATDSSLVTFVPAGTGATTRTAQAKMRDVVSVKDFGAVGDGVTNDTAAIQAAHVASTSVFYPRGTYLITWPESTSMVTYTSNSKIRITGDGAKLYDSRTYATGNFSNVFQFVSCTDISIEGISYEGQPIVSKSNPTTGIGYRGATFVNLSTNCSNISINANLKYLRYGIRAGDYIDYTQGENNNIRATLDTFECGYPVAFYLTTNVDLLLNAESGHRAAYLAGVCGGRVRAYFKNQYIAPSQVLVTDATTNNQGYPTGTSRGSSDLDIVAHDLGSTIYIDNSFCAAISMSRGDAGTLFENLNFDLYVKSSDTIASKVSAFAIYNSFLAYQPSYPNEWEQTFFFKNIKVTGTLDRSSQTTAENSGNGEIYVYAFSSGSNYGTVQGLDISGFKYYPGSGAKTRGFYYVVPGLIGTSSITNCDFGTATPFSLLTNATSLVSLMSTQLRGSGASTSDSPFNSAASFTDCTIYNPAFQPLTNKTFYNTQIKGSRTAVVTKIVDTAALSGATVTLTSAIPGGAVVVGVSAIVTTAITGATGFEIGVAADLTRYASIFTTTQGTTVTAVTNSTATAPINYASATNLLITSKTSAFTGGVIRVAIHYLSFTNLTL